MPRAQCDTTTHLQSHTEPDINFFDPPIDFTGILDASGAETDLISLPSPAPVQFPYPTAIDTLHTARSEVSNWIRDALQNDYASSSDFEKMNRLVHIIDSILEEPTNIAEGLNRDIQDIIDYATHQSDKPFMENIENIANRVKGAYIFLFLHGLESQVSELIMKAGNSTPTNDITEMVRLTLIIRTVMREGTYRLLNDLDAVIRYARHSNNKEIMEHVATIARNVKDLCVQEGYFDLVGH